MKNVYLLIFCIFLNNYFFFVRCCTTCVENDCGVTEGCEYTHDEKVSSEFYQCKFNDGKCINNTVNFDDYTCSSIGDKFSYLDEYMCSHYSGRYQLCVLTDNKKCQLKKCEEFSSNCQKLNYCRLKNRICKVNYCPGFITADECKDLDISKNYKIFCKWQND